MAALDDLAIQVAACNTVQASAIALLQGLGSKLKLAGTDPAKLASLSADLHNSTNALSDAVAANTVADPARPVTTPAAPAPTATGATVVPLVPPVPAGSVRR